LDCPLVVLLIPDYVKEKLPEFPQNVMSDLSGTVPVAVVGGVQAGLFKEALETPPEQRGTLFVPVNMPYANKPLKGFKVVGDSMNAWYPDGSFVVVCPSIYLGEGWLPATGQHVLVQRRNEWGEFEATVKEVAYDGDDLLLWPRSHNPSFHKPWRISGPKEIDPDSSEEPIRVTGLVVWSISRAPGT